jgi:hypothetical protein
MVLWEIWVHPNFDFPRLRKKDHLFCDVEVSHLLIEHFESLQTALVEIELVGQRNVIDLFQSQLYFADIK